MEIVPSDSALFRASVEALKDFLPIAQLRLSSEGIRINGMDVSHVGFVDYFLAAADCSVLKIPGPATIGINMTTLARVLANVGTGDKVTLGTNKTRDRLVLSYTNARASKKAVYEVPVLDIDMDPMELPDLSYSADVRARTSDICVAVKEVANFGDAIRLKLDEEGFHISASGDLGSVSQTLENTEDREMELNSDSAEALFASKYLVGIMKGGGALSTTTQLEFDPAQPLRATFRFGGGSYFIAYLAPKISE